MGVVGLRCNVDTAALLIGAVFFNQSGVEFHSVGNHVDATARARRAVASNTSAVHGESGGGNLGPLFRFPFTEVLLGPARTVGVDLPVGAGITVDVHIHRVHAATVGRTVAVEEAAVHSDVCVAEDIDAAAGECCFALRDFTVIELQRRTRVRCIVAGLHITFAQPVADIDISGPSRVFGDLSAVDCQMSTTENADATSFAIRVGAVVGHTLGDFAAVHHHRGAISQRHVRRTELTALALVVGDLAAVERELRVLALDGDCTFPAVAHLTGTLYGAGVHHQLAFDADGGGEGAAFHDVLVLRARVDDQALAVPSAVGKGELAALFDPDEAAGEVAVVADDLGA